MRPSRASRCPLVEATGEGAEDAALGGGSVGERAEEGACAEEDAVLHLEGAEVSGERVDELAEAPHAASAASSAERG